MTRLSPSELEAIRHRAMASQAYPPKDAQGQCRTVRMSTATREFFARARVDVLALVGHVRALEGELAERLETQ